MNKTRAFARAILPLLAICGLVVAISGCSGTHPPSTAPTDQTTQATYSTPEQAAQALVDAIRADDSAQLKSVLGPSYDQVLFSGDSVADEQHEQKFVRLYDEKHTLIPGDNGAMTLTVGANDWPTPIPLVSDGKGWRFDTQAGLDEILNRRIGANELATIQVCLAIVDAEREYEQRNPTGGELPQYAQKFLSDPGQKNGLYWETAEGESPSPLGPLVAEATEQGYPQPTAETASHSYHGYLYHILKSQGPNAPGGAYDYVVDGKMIGGFAVVAYPAEYGNSGIMTFIVSYEGTVYQKDMGQDTRIAAESMLAFDPGEGWTKVQQPDTNSSDDAK
jgi:hypothetical protein